MSRVLRRVAVAVVLGSLAMLSPDWAALADVAVEVTSAGQVLVGDHVEVTVRVTDAGAPVAGTMVVLSRNAEFAGVEDRLELARAVTDTDGVVVLTYQQRTGHSGALEVTLADYPEVAAVLEVEVAESGRQLYRPRSGVQVPGLNVLMLVAIVGGVWIMMLAGIGILFRMARIGAARPEDRIRLGLHPPAVPLLLFSLAMAIGAVLLVVLARNPTTHANLEGPEGHDRTPHAHLGELTPYEGFGLEDPSLLVAEPVAAGWAAYTGYGCVGCHGLGGSGALVGGDLDSAAGDDWESFASDVRRGPKVMPEYVESVLADEELALIQGYLETEAGD